MNRFVATPDDIVWERSSPAPSSRKNTSAGNAGHGPRRATPMKNMSATRNGITISLVKLGRDDFSTSWQVEVTDTQGGRCFVPTWRCERHPDGPEAGARAIANEIYRGLDREGLTALEARDTRSAR